MKRRVIGTTLAAVLLLASCGDDSEGDDEDATSNADAPEEDNCDLEDLTWVAYGLDATDVPEIAVYDEPEGSETSTVPNPWSTAIDDPEMTTPPSFVIKDDQETPLQDEWLHVDLPTSPTGSEGYIRSEDVSVHCIAYRVTIDRDALTLTVTYEGEPVLGPFDVGLGQDERATNPGNYFITEHITPTDEGGNPVTDGVYGTRAYGINGYADDPDIIADFPDSGGQVGIHGTNQPDALPGNVSSGCVRLRNEDVDQLNGVIPWATPVDVV